MQAFRTSVEMNSRMEVEVGEGSVKCGRRERRTRAIIVHERVSRMRRQWVLNNSKGSTTVGVERRKRRIEVVGEGREAVSAAERVGELVWLCWWWDDWVSVRSSDCELVMGELDGRGRIGGVKYLRVVGLAGWLPS